MEAVIDRIRKLIAFGQGTANENEAAAFMEKAQALLAAHNLEMSDVLKKGESAGDIIEDAVNTPSSDPWRRVLAANVARLYFCEHWWGHWREYKETRKCGYVRHDQHVFVGFTHNTGVAKEMFKYLSDTVERLAKEERRKRKAGNAFEKSFRHGCGERLAQRCADRWFEQTREPERALIAGNKLPALYKQNDAEVSEYMSRKHTDLTLVDKKAIINDESGKLAGWAAGGDVGFDTQITGRDKPVGLIEK